MTDLQDCAKQGLCWDIDFGAKTKTVVGGQEEAVWTHGFEGTRHDLIPYHWYVRRIVLVGWLIG